MEILGKLNSLNNFQTKSTNLKTYKEPTNLFSKNNLFICNLKSFPKLSREMSVLSGLTSLK